MKIASKDFVKDFRAKNKDTLLKKRKVKKVKKKKIKKLNLNLELKSKNKNKKKFSLLEEKEEKKVTYTNKKVILQYLLLKNTLSVRNKVIQLDSILQMHRDALTLIIKKQIKTYNNFK